MFHLCLIFSLMPLLSFGSATELTEAVSLATTGLEEIHTSSDAATNTCISKPTLSLCPQKLLEDLRDNRGRMKHWLSRKFGMRTGNEICNISEGDPNSRISSFKDSASLEATLSNDPRFAVGLGPNALNSCLDRPGLNYGPEEKKAFVSSYYYERNRVSQGGLAALEAIAKYNALLGEKPDFWKNQECQEPSIPGAKEFCEAQVSCKQNSHNSEIRGKVRSTELLLPAYDKLQLELNKLGRLRIPAAERKKKQESIKKAMVLITEHAPWIKEGTLFRKEYEEGQKLNPNLKSGNIMVALRKQLRSDRDAMMNQWKKVKDASTCLSNEDSRGKNDCKDYETTVKSLPEFIPPVDDKSSERKKELSLKYEIETGRCLFEGQDLSNEGARILNGFATDVAVTIGTMGAGAIVSGVRASAAGASGVMKLGKVGKAIYGTALVGGASLELYLGYDDFKVAADSCFNEATALPAWTSPVSTSGNSCVAADMEQLAVARQNSGFNLTHCLISAGVASLNLLPVVGPSLSRLHVRTADKGVQHLELVDDSLDISHARSVNNVNTPKVADTLPEAPSPLLLTDSSRTPIVSVNGNNGEALVETVNSGKVSSLPDPSPNNDMTRALDLRSMPDEPHVSYEINGRTEHGRIVAVDSRTGELTIIRVDGTTVKVRRNALSKIQRSAEAHLAFSTLRNLARALRDYTLSSSDNSSSRSSAGHSDGGTLSGDTPGGSAGGVQGPDDQAAVEEKVVTNPKTPLKPIQEKSPVIPNIDPNLKRGSGFNRGAGDLSAQGIR